MRFTFEKQDFIKMGGTALITAVLLSVFDLVPVKTVFRIDASKRISLDSARIFAREYVQYRRRLYVWYEDSLRPGNFVRDTLKALRFDANDLDEIINHNKNPKVNADSTRDSTADQVLIYFGKHSDSRGVANLSIIAVGLKDGRLMLNRQNPADSNASSLFDKTRPCPGSPGCPRGFD